MGSSYVELRGNGFHAKDLDLVDFGRQVVNGTSGEELERRLGKSRADYYRALAVDGVGVGCIYLALAEIIDADSTNLDWLLDHCRVSNSSRTYPLFCMRLHDLLMGKIIGAVDDHRHYYWRFLPSLR